MARSINKVILVGHVGSAPEVRSTSAGTMVANISMATNRPPREGHEPETDWHRLVVWGKLAEFVEQYVTQGDRIYVEGNLNYDSYERDGVTIPTAQVKVREIVLLSPRKDS
jgi:single-strand DNA-binding protein